MSKPTPVVLCIMDGWGLREDPANNAPAMAATPTYDRIMETCPHATLITHGPDVGLPTGQMGNSEVGHTNIGAGRVVAMDLGQIDLAIEDGSFFDNARIAEFAETLQKSNGTAHLIGLASPGGVHSHQDHIVAAAKALRKRDIPVVVHAITDGRDVPPQSAADQVSKLVRDLPEGVRIVTVSGRYFAMDRDTRWERVERAYRAMVPGEGASHADPVEGILASYDSGKNDEFIEPFIVEGYTGMRPEDGVFFINFRADRAREVLSAIGDPDFDGFDVGARPDLAAMLGMVDYSKRIIPSCPRYFPSRKS